MLPTMSPNDISAFFYFYFVNMCNCYIMSLGRKFISCLNVTKRFLINILTMFIVFYMYNDDKVKEGSMLSDRI